jgi:acetylornithine deacetylase
LTNWGEPFLLGPGSIHVAHTPNERIAKQELLECVDLYEELASELIKGSPASSATSPVDAWKAAEA